MMNSKITESISITEAIKDVEKSLNQELVTGDNIDGVSLFGVVEEYMALYGPEDYTLKVDPKRITMWLIKGRELTDPGDLSSLLVSDDEDGTIWYIDYSREVDIKEYTPEQIRKWIAQAAKDICSACGYGAANDSDIDKVVLRYPRKYRSKLKSVSKRLRNTYARDKVMNIKSKE